MKVLLGKAILFEKDNNVNVEQFNAAVEFETAQLKLRFPDYTEVIGVWKGFGCNRKYVLYAVEQIGEIDEM